MKKVYKIEVDCAACANLMEASSKKVSGVEDVTVNFMTQKITVTFSDGADEKTVMKDIVKCCKKVDSDCEVYLPGKAL